MSQSRPPYSVHLPPDVARASAQSGGSLLLLDVPEGTQFVLDHQAFVVGPQFKGVKMLPPGPHFVACMPVSKEGDVAMPTGFFVHLESQQVVVRRWSHEMEALAVVADEDEVERYVAGVHRFDFDAHLAPYDLGRYPEWKTLSHYISKETCHELFPVSGCISIMEEVLDPSLMDPKTEAEKRLMAQLQEGRQRRAAQEQPAAAEAAQGVAAIDTDAAGQLGSGAQAAPSTSGRTAGRCFYTQLPRLVKASGVPAAELTALNLDRSGQLDSILAQRYQGRGDMLLGELQFAFVAFMYGQSLDGFFQWKSLVLLLLGCEDAAVHTRQPLFVSFLRVLHAQLLRSLGAEAGQDTLAPLGGSMVDEMLPDSFLRKAFSNFFEVLHDNASSVGPELSQQAQKLQRLLKQRLGWDFQMELLGDEEDEYAPVVVEL